MIHNGETIIDEVADGVIEMFNYLKKNNKEIVVLTSWFSGTQIPRLKRTGLYSYIDNEETVILDGKLLEGKDKELEEFLRHLLED